MVWCRARDGRPFPLDSRTEVYVPREKRKWGYYVLPFLLGDRLVARVDLKADRVEHRLRVLAAYAEPGGRSADVARALAGELRTVSAWLGLGSVTVERRGNFARLLAAILEGSGVRDQGIANRELNRNPQSSVNPQSAIRNGCL
ncbi:MAG: DNA glycosylase AlkZ-like family protein [Acidobacteriota bacterium]